MKYLVIAMTLGNLGDRNDVVPFFFYFPTKIQYISSFFIAALDLSQAILFFVPASI